MMTPIEEFKMRTYISIIIFLFSFLNAAPIKFDDVLIPPPPSIKAKSYVLMDATTGTVIAEKPTSIPSSS